MKKDWKKEMTDAFARERRASFEKYRAAEKYFTPGRVACLKRGGGFFRVVIVEFRKHGNSLVKSYTGKEYRVDTDTIIHYNQSPLTADGGGMK